MAPVLHIYLCPQQHKYILLDMDDHPPAVSLPCYIDDCQESMVVQRTVTQDGLCDIAVQKVLSGTPSVFGG